MIVVCKSCESAYPVDSVRLAAAGGRVRCSACGAGWRVDPRGGASPRAIGVEAVSHAADSTAVPFMRGEAIAPRSGVRGLAPGFAAAAAIAFVMLAIGQRARVAAVFPPAADLYAAIGLPLAGGALSIVDVRSALLEGADGRPTLAVTGRIVNSGRVAANAPKLGLRVLGAGGEPLYSWAARATARELAPGEAAPFRVALAAPPEGAREIAVRFTDGEAK